MPKYKVTAPDGRNITLEGDSPPTESELNEIFKTISKPDSSILGKAKQIGKSVLAVPEQFSYGGMETMGITSDEFKPEPKNIPEKIAHGAGKTLGLVADPSGIAGSTYETAAKAAGVGMKKALSTGAGQAVSKVGNLAKEGAIDLYSLAGSWLSSRPKEYMDYAINAELSGKSIFKGGKYSPVEDAEVGKKIARGLRLAEKSEGAIVGMEKRAVKQSKKKIDVEPFLNTIDSLISERTRDKISELTPSDMDKINQIKRMFTKGTQAETKTSSFVDPYGVPITTETKAEPAKAERLLAIKSRIEDITGYKINEADKLSKGAQAILGKLKADISEYLSREYQPLKESYARYAALQEARKKLGAKISDVNAEKLVRNFENQPVEIKEMLMQINDSLPPKLQFMDDILRVNMRKSFSELWPGRGGGSGSAEGIKNIVRSRMVGDLRETLTQGANIGAKGGLALYTNLTTVPLMSPRVNQALIQGMGVAKKAKIPKPPLQKTSGIMQNLYNQEQEFKRRAGEQNE